MSFTEIRRDNMRKNMVLVICAALLISACAKAGPAATEAKATEAVTEAATSAPATTSAPTTVAPETEPEIPEGMEVATAFVFELEENQEDCVSNLIFNEPVIVRGNFGQQAFDNCIFNADVINEATEATRIVILETCRFNNGARCVFRSGIKEAGIEYSNPKIFLYLPAEVIFDGNVGTAMALGHFDFTADGVVIKESDAENFIDDEHPEQGIVPYTGQKSSVHGIAKWQENGKQVEFTLCEYTPGMD